MLVTNTKDLKLSVTTEENGNVLFHCFVGSLEVGNVPEAKELIAPSWERENPQILFDLAGIEYVDSAGLGFLIGTLRRAAQAGGSLKLCGLSAYLTGVFGIVNLQNILETFRTKEDALESYQ
jgi:anti-sigma B factor antagonist